MLLQHPAMAISGIGFEIALRSETPPRPPPAPLIEALDTAPHHPSMGWECRWFGGAGRFEEPENER